MKVPVGRWVVPAQRLRSLLGDPPPSTPEAEVAPLTRNPLVSVVVPVYQVEDYLAECLDSLLRQAYRRLEIVVVDDGSTDRSAQIARAYADRDGRIVMIRQDNAGLGAARNTGLDHCTGELVTFVDSDDRVPPAAFLRMVRALEQSGSDFVVGAVTRELGGVSTVKPWVKQAHSRLRTGITIDDAPHMLINNLAPTKVFRRDFLERHSLRFPEGTSYEDQVPMTKAYLLARAFDVVPDVVYEWRIRDDRTSISQQKAETRDLVDKLAGQREVAEFLHARASPEVLHRWYAKTLHHDFLSYVQIAADAEDSYWQVLQESIVSIARQAPKDLDDEVELRVRLAVWLARHGHRDALRRLVGHEDFAASNFPVQEREGRLYADVGFLGEYDAVPPDHLLRIRAVDQRLVTRLEALDWTTQGRLGIRALAAMPYLDPSLHRVATSYQLLGPATLPAIGVQTQVVESPSGNLKARRAHEDHTRSTVSGQIDLGALVAADDGKQVTRWELRAVVSAFGVRSNSVLDSRRGTDSAVATRAVLVAGSLVCTRWSDQRGLLLEVHRRYAAVTGAVLRDGAFEVDVHASGLGSVTQVLVGATELPVSVLPGPDETSCTLRLPGATAGAAPPVGRLRIAVAGSRPVPLRVLGSLGPYEVGDGRVCLGSDADGFAVVERDRPCLLVDRVELDEATALLTGRAHLVSSASAVVTGPRAQTTPSTVHVVDGRFWARVPLRHARWEGVRTVLPPDFYGLVVTAGARRVRVLAGQLFDGVDQPAAHGWSVAVGADRRLFLRRSRTAEPAQFSRFRQRQLRSGLYAATLRRPPRDLALFQASGGTGTGDGAGAVFRALLEQGTGLELVWSVNDPSVAAPDGSRALIRGTPEWFDAMGSARLLVSNDTFPEFFRKSPGRTYLQMWHGTPLKRIGRDIGSSRLSTEHHLRLLLREARTWDFLVSSGPYCTRIFRQALAYDGEILEVGRPGNDVLLSPRAAEIRSEVRAHLGIGDPQTLVLYAPTWRDNAPRGSSWEKVLHLDHHRVTAARPDVTVLVRGHPNTVGAPDARGADRVVDVTSYPDIARLYLAADVLVTDYSAAMFDFALTDKPIVVLAPDLDQYRDQVRGLYLDLESMAPGPVVTSTDEVLDALDDDSWALARKQLCSTYAPYDDGAATRRVLDAVLPALSPGD